MMNHFNQKAKEWDSPEKVTKMKELAIKVKKHLNFAPQKILDFGCGTGLFGMEFLTESNLLHGLDTSEGMLEVFQSKISTERGRAILIDENDDITSKLDKDYDLIISSMAFHHLKKPLEILQKLKASLREGGRIIIIDLDQEDGSFHPDNASMGVHHHGFSKELLGSWGISLGCEFRHEIINILSKNGREYGQFMAMYSNC